MSFKITNINGPLLQESYEFDGASPVKIGRDDTKCQVLYDPMFNAVGGEHLTIVEDVGRYEVRTNTRHPVFVDGVKVGDDCELPDSCVIALGTKSGPSFRFERLSSHDMPKTIDYGHSEEIHSSVKGNRKRIVITALVAVLGVMGLSYKSWLTDQEMDQMEQEAKRQFSTLFDEVNTDIGALAKQASKSVYLVLVKTDTGETPIGTAWVVSDSALATNAHVAQVFDDIADMPEMRFVVRSTTAPYTEHVINRVAAHPAYDRFEQVWSEVEPRVIQADGNVAPVEFIPSYDVALLYPESIEGLAKPLKVAEGTTLNNLSAGDTVAYIGFPMEGVMQSAFIEPTPQIQIANITSITDFFRGQAFFGEGYLIQHSLPATGGASGSPIINRKGEVIALLNAGNVIGLNENGLRIPHAVAINYAQRADLLNPLLTYGADFAIDDIVASWQKGFAKFANQEQAMAATNENIRRAVLQGWREYFGLSDEPKLLASGEINLNVDKTIENIPAQQLLFKTESTGRHLLVAIAGDNSNVKLWIGAEIDGKVKEFGRDNNNEHFAYIDLEAKAGTQLVAYAFAPDMKSDGKTDTKVKYWFYSAQ